MTPEEELEYITKRLEERKKEMAASHKEWVDLAFVNFGSSAIAEELKALVTASYYNKIEDLLYYQKKKIKLEEEMKIVPKKEEDLPF